MSPPVRVPLHVPPGGVAHEGGGHSALPPPPAQVFALIVFSCIFGEGYSNTHNSHQQYCVFNRNEDACRYGAAIGVLAFLASAFFFVVDAYFPQISNATDRKYLVIGDLLFSGIGQLPAPPFDLGVNRSSSVPRSSRGLWLKAGDGWEQPRVPPRPQSGWHSPSAETPWS